MPFDALRHPEVEVILEGLDLDEDRRTCYLEGDFRYTDFRLQEDRERFAPYLPGLPEEAALSGWGVGKIALKSVEGYHAGHKTFHPLAQVNTAEELEAFPFPNVTDESCHGHLEETVREAKEQEFTIVGDMSQTILEIAYEMRGIERLLLDLYERPAYVERLFDKLCERRCFQARRFAEAGIDILHFGDDIATQSGLLISPDAYRKWIKPRHAALIEAARKVNPDIPVQYHSDGRLTPLLNDLIEIGVTAINPCQPECMDPAVIKQEFGDQLVLWGCTGVQSVYACGSKEDVLNEIRARMATVAPGGGFIVEFTNIILTGKVLENLRYFYESFYDLARYD